MGSCGYATQWLTFEGLANRPLHASSQAFIGLTPRHVQTVRLPAISLPTCAALGRLRCIGCGGKSTLEALETAFARFAARKTVVFEK